MLSGRVLDYGCGRQPYRPIVEAAGGTYIPYDRASYQGSQTGENIGPSHPLTSTYDTILCTQVLQECPDFRELLVRFRSAAPVLVLTWTLTWREYEGEIVRWTAQGMNYYLAQAGYDASAVTSRGVNVTLMGETLTLGYGVIAA
jgi:hypothetical protein